MFELKSPWKFYISFSMFFFLLKGFLKFSNHVFESYLNKFTLWNAELEIVSEAAQKQVQHNPTEKEK